MILTAHWIEQHLALIVGVAEVELVAVVQPVIVLQLLPHHHTRWDVWH